MKDFIPFLSIFTVLLASFLAISGAYLNSRQNMRYKWLEDFREAMSSYNTRYSKFNYLSQTLRKSFEKNEISIEDMTEFANITSDLNGSLTQIIYLLNQNNPLHLKFQSLLTEQQMQLSDYAQNEIESVEIKSDEIYQVGKAIYLKIQNIGYFNFWSTF